MVTTEKHIEEMMLDAQAAADPSVRGEEVDLEDGVKGKMDVEHPGRVFVYDIRNGERSEVLAHPDYLRQQLLKTDREPSSPYFGRRIFTTVKPAIEPFRGKFLCPLHKDNPDAKNYFAMGLRPCAAAKSNLVNANEALNHMKKKHKNEWETIEAERQRQIEQEERELRRLNIESLSRAFAVPAQPAPAPEAPVSAAAASVTPPPGAAAAVSVGESAKHVRKGILTSVSVNCPQCSEVIVAKNRGGINLKMKSHQRKYHAGE